MSRTRTVLDPAIGWRMLVKLCLGKYQNTTLAPLVQGFESGSIAGDDVMLAQLILYGCGEYELRQGRELDTVVDGVFLDAIQTLACVARVDLYTGELPKVEVKPRSTPQERFNAVMHAYGVHCGEGI